MTSFFLAGIGGGKSAVENAYGNLRKQVELDIGRRPSARRILSLWTRRGGVDGITEVGRRDRLLGGTVITIFDMGPHQPFVVWMQDELWNREGVREILGCSAYSVLEFDP